MEKFLKKEGFILFLFLLSILFLQSTSAATCAEMCSHYHEHSLETYQMPNPYWTTYGKCFFFLVNKGQSSDAKPGESCYCYDTRSALSNSTCAYYGVTNTICQPQNCTSNNWNCGFFTEENCGAWLHCGRTPPGETCTNHFTANPCVSFTCESMGWECGYGIESNCERVLYCGECPNGEYCIDNICTTDCTPDCTDKECGIDGCNGVCGQCAEGEQCIDWKCVSGPTCKQYSLSHGFGYGSCMDYDYEAGFGKSECWGNTCYYNFTTQTDTSAFVCNYICNSYNIALDCGSDETECDNIKCHPWGCCEKDGTSCPYENQNDSDCCSNWCKNNVCQFECIDDDDCNEANGYGPGFFCENHRCKNSCLNGNWIKSGQPQQSYHEYFWGYRNITTAGCCGDEELEKYKFRNVNCTVNCETNDYPSFTTDNTDEACCNSTSSCVNLGLCYPPIKSVDISGEELICNNSKWFDCDTENNYCENYCNDNWIKSGEANVGEYDSTSKVECCGDDSNEFYVDSSGYQGHSASDKACCDDKDCVLNGICYNSNYSGGHENINTCYDGKDNDCDGKTDFCDGWLDLGCGNKGADSDCEGTIKGTITDTYNQKVAGALVKVLTIFKYNSFNKTISFNTTTDANGDFSLTVYGNSNYDAVVTKLGYYMMANESKHVGLRDTWNLNVELARDEECNPDCTKGFGKLCFADCNSKNGCNFFNQKSMNLCNGQGKYFIKDYNVTHEVECCEGIPQIKKASQKPKVTVNAKTIVRISKPVLYRGKLINMIILIAK